ncbi:GMC family oxidoreductase [Devosia sp. FJ2-5-3]|uniref:GMC family oxidoreductase n=1 Tax=Devosia sp. FJ2-5-3 TaxID=2976680 RepID=UPI0023D86994|nr:GMC family oxidoreductase [Devosia sp. FJ2-5-3]WEJ57076.1 GMC family oxidoreductase [Devosia sp. FJ2-5-3]
MKDLNADVVVIGAGPTGAAVAWRLASQGVDVICIDRGEWFDYEAICRDAADWEGRRGSVLHSNPNVRRGAYDYPVDDVDTPIKPMIGNGIGGSSVYWSAHVPRFRPEDFRVKTLDGVGDDWPVAYEDLAAYYQLNEDRWGVASWPGDPSAAPHAENALTLPTIGAHGTKIARVFNQLGWHWWPVDLVVGRDGDAPENGHCTHIGPCDLGCPSRVRSGADRAFAKEAVASGARFVTGTRVLKLEHDASGMITSALCRSESGDFRVTGKRFVISGNGMGTPRLLLLSASEMFPDGLANSSGLVGRNLMLHPYARVDGHFEEPVGAWVSGEKAGLVSFEFYATRPEHDFKRGLKLQLTGGPGPLALAKGAVYGKALPWGAGHHEAFEKRFDHVCGFTVCAEDLAELHNTITLSSVLKDSDGLPAPKMTYTLSENSRKILDFGMERAEEVLRMAGATEIFETQLRAEAGFHIMGTARMGEDAKTSVVDPFGRCHDVPNLYLADASVFVTSAAINPTATAQALALRTADHIVATRHA